MEDLIGYPLEQAMLLLTPEERAGYHFHTSCAREGDSMDPLRTARIVWVRGNDVYLSYFKDSEPRPMESIE